MLNPEMEIYSQETQPEELCNFYSQPETYVTF